METLTNREVDVTAFYFNQQAKACFPRRIEVNGQPVAVLETGLRMLVRSGQKIVEIFNMTDGFAQYNLRYEPDARIWTLLNSHSL
jgi:hypothetical protein